MDSLIAAIESRTNSKQGQTLTAPTHSQNSEAPKRHGMSAATKAKLRRIMKAKWAAKKSGSAKKNG